MAGYLPQEEDFRRIPGDRTRRYENVVTGERVSYHQYLKVHYGGFSSHQFARLNKESPKLVTGYKSGQGSYSGLSLALGNLKDSKKGRERRLALIPFYPSAEDADDDDYLS